jgi:hypothetical protein
VNTEDGFWPKGQMFLAYSASIYFGDDFFVQVCGIFYTFLKTCSDHYGIGFLKSKKTKPMKEGWILVYIADAEFKAKIAEDVLKQNEIVSHILSKPDSAIPSIGRAELYAPEEQADQAREILRKEGLEPVGG